MASTLSTAVTGAAADRRGEEWSGIGVHAGWMHYRSGVEDLHSPYDDSQGSFAGSAVAGGLSVQRGLGRVDFVGLLQVAYLKGRGRYQPCLIHGTSSCPWGFGGNHPLVRYSDPEFRVTFVSVDATVRVHPSPWAAAMPFFLGAGLRAQYDSSTGSVEETRIDTGAVRALSLHGYGFSPQGIAELGWSFFEGRQLELVVRSSPSALGLGGDARFVQVMLGWML